LKPGKPNRSPWFLFHYRSLEGSLSESKFKLFVFDESITGAGVGDLRWVNWPVEEPFTSRYIIGVKYTHERQMAIIQTRKLIFIFSSLLGRWV
jgi:hypothetical protein